MKFSLEMSRPSLQVTYKFVKGENNAYLFVFPGSFDMLWDEV
jgi:hypothetical protein